MTEREIFLTALEIEDAAARQAYLQTACAGDAELLARVESLLTLNDRQSQFLATPVVEQLAGESENLADATLMFDKDSTEDAAFPTAKSAWNGTEAMTGKHDGESEEISLGYLQASDNPGSLGRLGHYEVLEVVGRGAFGTVLRAFDEKLQRVVAIKVLSPEMAATSPARKRFLREARTSAAIRHENVVAIYAVEDEPIPYLVMEYIPGETLQQRLDAQGPLGLREVVKIATQVAKGLAAAHAQGLIHRDIKPGNILLEGGVSERVKITDFGLARAADDASMTQSGLIAGTPMYMAPEQARGDALDQRADLFSFGSVLYQMVSGRPPFRAMNTIAVLKRVVEDTPRPIREIIPETPQWFCDIVTKLHAKNPDQRYQSTQEVANVLANCEEQLKLNTGMKDLAITAQTRPHASAAKKWMVAAVVVLPLALVCLSFLNRPATKVDATKNDPIRTPSVVATPVEAGNSKKSPGWTPTVEQQAFFDAVAKMPAEEQIEAVRKKLVESNPGFDGKVAGIDAIGHAGGLPKIEGGVVTTFSCHADDISALWPVRAFVALKMLSCESSATTTKSAKLSDLSPLTGMKLTHLFCNYTGVADLTPLVGMPLKHLGIGGTLVTNLDPLQGMPLVGLYVNNTPVRDLSPLRDLPLQNLLLDRTQVSDLSPLEKCVRLRLLNVKQTRVTAAQVAALRTSLTNCKISWDPPPQSTPPVPIVPFTDADITRIAALPPERQVEEVRQELMRRNPQFDGKVEHKIEGNAVTEIRMQTDQVSDIAPLRAFNSLTHLHCTGTYPAKGVLADLSPLRGMSLSKLKELDLRENNIRDADLFLFQDCRGLILLGLSGPGVTDEGLAHFRQCNDLKMLFLKKSGITDAGLALFQGHPSLQKVILEATKVTDLGLSHLQHCKQLTHVFLSNTRITDAGLAHLKDCQNLRQIGLSITLVTQAGLAHLKNCRLISLDIKRTKVTDLTDLKNWPLTDLECDFIPARDTEILRSIPTLERINQKPADLFWKEVETK